MRVSGSVKGADEVVKRLRKKRTSVIDRHLGLISRDIVAEARAFLSWYRRSGDLEVSLKARRAAALIWQIIEGAAHGLFFRGGTRPHMIFPGVKKALWWPGLDHPVAYVNHPGTKAVPYPEFVLRRAKRSIDLRLANLARVIGGEIVRRFA